jgi:formamidopyrimidine-DNA glycosylase
LQHLIILFDENTGSLSAKAFLATEQRIPGLGNGVLQDILWKSRIHPRRKMADLSDRAIQAMYGAVKSVLAEMAARGGRDTLLPRRGRLVHSLCLGVLFAQAIGAL